MAINFFSGFEANTATEWPTIVGACQLENAIKHTGYNCLRMFTNEATLQSYVATANCKRCSFWIFIDFPFTYADGRLCGTDSQIAVSRRSDGKLELWDGTSSLGVSSSVLPLEEWHRISISFDSTNDSVKLYLDDVEEISSTSATSSTTTGGTYGVIENNVGQFVFLDDVVQDDIESTDDLGNICVRRSRVAGAGNYTQFDSYQPSSTHWQNVDDFSASDGDYNWHDAKTAVKECYTLQDSSLIGLVSSDVIKAIKTICRMKRGSGGGSTHNILVRDNGQDYETSVSLITSFDYYDRLDLTMPNGGGDWTQDRFDAFEVGMSYGGEARDPYISQAIVMVAYQPEQVEPSPSGTISAQSSLSGVAKAIKKATGDFSGQSSVSGTAKVIRRATGGFSGQSFLSASGLKLKRAIGSFSVQSSLSGVAKVIRRAIGIVNSLSSLVGRLTKVTDEDENGEQGDEDEIRIKEKIKMIQISFQEFKPDNQQVIGEGQVIIIGTESDNQSVMGENVVDLDVDNVINT